MLRNTSQGSLYIAVLWMICMAFSSSLNDALTKKLSCGGIPASQIVFLRMFMSCVTVVVGLTAYHGMTWWTTWWRGTLASTCQAPSDQSFWLLRHVFTRRAAALLPHEVDDLSQQNRDFPLRKQAALFTWMRYILLTLLCGTASSWVTDKLFSPASQKAVASITGSKSGLSLKAGRPLPQPNACNTLHAPVPDTVSITSHSMTTSISDALVQAAYTPPLSYPVWFQYLFCGILGFLLLTACRVISLQSMSEVRTAYFWVHALRGIGFFLGIWAWSRGLSSVPLSVAAVVGFSIPLSTLLLSFVLRFEVVRLRTCAATLLGFGGILLASTGSRSSLDPMVLWLWGASFIFALLDLLNKRLVDVAIIPKEKSDGLIALLFYSSLWTLVSSIVYAAVSQDLWLMPGVQDIIYSLVLGLSSNLVLFFWLKAIENSPSLSSLQPFKYLEFLTSLGLAWLIFAEIPESSVLWSAGLIIPAGFFVGRSQHTPPQEF